MSLPSLRAERSNPPSACGAMDCFRVRAGRFGGLPALRSLRSKRRRVVTIAPRNDDVGLFEKVETTHSAYLAPLAGRGVGRLWRPSLRTPKRSFGYVASSDAIRV